MSNFFIFFYPVNAMRFRKHALDVGTHFCACNAAASSSKSSRSMVKPDTVLSGYVLAHLHIATVIGFY